MTGKGVHWQVKQPTTTKAIVRELTLEGGARGEMETLAKIFEMRAGQPVLYQINLTKVRIDYQNIQISRLKSVWPHKSND